MLSYARTTCATPIAFQENKHHWAFKYWKGNSIETGRKIVGEICSENTVRTFSMPGQLRTEYAVCSRHFNYDLFCSCCKIDNYRQTLLRIVGNLIGPFCDLERYMNSGLDHLEPYVEIMPKDWNQSIEVLNLQELIEKRYSWSELVNRIYSRRHWVAVRELASRFVNCWLGFFDEVQNRTTPFTAEEKQVISKNLLEPAHDRIFNGELLLTAEEFDRLAPQNIAKMIQFSELEEIPSQTLIHLKTLRNSDIHCIWNHRSIHLNRRGSFVEMVVGKRERHRRATNLMRKINDPNSSLRLEPSRKLSSVFLEEDHPFTLPQREYVVCTVLMDNAYFAEEFYWPIVDTAELGYRHSIIRVELEQFPALLESILFDLGEISELHFVIGPSNEVPAAITGFLVPNDPTLSTLIERVCQVAAATDFLKIDVVKSTTDLVLIQLRGHIIDEVEAESWQ